MSDVTFLVPDFRGYIGDTVEPYTFTDDLLETSLFTSLKLLGRRWRYRYLLDEDDAVTRNSDASFQTTAPVIDFADQAAIIVQASIVVKSAKAWDSSWDVASWRDDEVAYSNIQGARSRDTSIASDQDLLDKILVQRLHPGLINSMPGFHPPLNTIENS